MKTVKVMFGFPWYAGPDSDCYTKYFEQMHYFGRLRERCEWINYMGQAYGRDAQVKSLEAIGALDPMGADPLCEISLDEAVRFEFSIADESRLSLPGLARDRIVDCALTWGADYLFMWDSDMLFSWGAFLRLWRHQKPIVAALAFTARAPYSPVIYRIKESTDPIHGLVFESSTVLEYPKNQLIGSSDIGGSLAFGAGVVLYNTSVFKEIGKPWFHSTGCGEDWMFCVRCHQHNVPRYMDTSVKTLHKQHKPNWVDEGSYEEYRAENPDMYKTLEGK